MITNDFPLSAALTARTFVGEVFIMAGLSKLFGAENFASGVKQLPIISRFTGIITPVVPVIEVLAGTGTVIGFATAEWGIIALLSMFTVVLSVAVAKRLQVRCNCFGASDSTIVSKLTIWRNFGLMLLLLFGVTSPPGTSLAIPIAYSTLLLFAIGTFVHLQRAEQG